MVLDNFLRELQSENKAIRVGLVGAGFAARGFALQLLTRPLGMKLAAVSNRTLCEARRAYSDAGIENVRQVSDSNELANAIADGQYAITTDPMLLCSSQLIDVIVEATGEVEFGAQVAMSAIAHDKHILLINAELDSTIGPILKVKADQAGVVYTQADGDQPAVIMNLYKQVESLGFRPVMAGNIKSLIDCRRTPETQRQFAEEHFQRPKMITSFADGTKISMEMATVANATGFHVGARGMYGPRCSHVDEAAGLFPMEQMLDGGLIDYILGAEPSFGVFILGYSEHPLKQRYMDVYKMGRGPLYTFYVPTHLSCLEAPQSVARAYFFKDAAISPMGKPVCDVVTIAKRDLREGEVLDGIGGFTCYGAIENAGTSMQQGLLPMGLSEGCVVKRDLRTDSAITYADVALPRHRIADELRKQQCELWPEGN